MTNLVLDLVGEAPQGVSLEPTRKVFGALASSQEAAVDGIINLTFVDDKGIRELNQRYTGNDYATDVLSFSYIEDGGEPIEGVIGEIAVSLETAAAQAKAAGTTLAEEVALLVLHGSLHILGHDHQTRTEQDEMQRSQRDFITAAGYNYREFQWKEQ